MGLLCNRHTPIQSQIARKISLSDRTVTCLFAEDVTGSIDRVVIVLLHPDGRIASRFICLF